VRVLLFFVSGAIGLAAASASAQVVFDDDVPVNDSRFVLLPFTVPPGTVEIEFAHDDLSEANILDWGLLDANGFRGWGGGNTEPAIVGLEAASRSYWPGPIEGEWMVVIGKAKIAEPPGHYRVEITFRTTATLAAMPERRPYAPVAALESTARWYAGDFHVHSRESGDAQPTLDEIAVFARGRGLDFVMLSEHNTVSQLELTGDAQDRHPDLLFLPGVEFTTYNGHANGIGATEHVDFRIGEDGVTIDGALRAFHDQGAVVSVNHPALDLGNLCIGCAWKHEVDPASIDAIELATGAYSRTGFVFLPLVTETWEEWLDAGGHVAAIGGSDDHRAGTGTGMLDSAIGSPTTRVFATELSTAAIVEGVRRGRTVVKLEGPDDPMLELTAGDAMLGDTIALTRFTLRAVATGAATGDQIRFVRNGEVEHMVEVGGDPFEATLDADAPYGENEDRWRVELWTARTPRVITSHLYVTPQPGSPPVPSTGCGCSTGERGGVLAWLIAIAIVVRRRRSRA
jgi:MYXO-CTERM domain-containing protein